MPDTDADVTTTAAPPAPRLADLAVDLLAPRRVEVAREGEPDDPADDLAEDDAETERLRSRLRTASRGRTRPAAAQARRRALGELTAHADRVRRRRAGQQVGHGRVPALLDQVVDAIESSSGSGHRTAAGPHRSPIGLSAAALVADIERHVGGGPRRELVSRCWAWVRSGPADAQVLAGWVSRAHAVIDPPRPVELAAPCPQCGVAVVHTPDDSGERVRRPALAIDRVSGTVSCCGCRASWGPDLWEFLARVLDDQARALRAEQAAVLLAQQGGSLDDPRHQVEQPGRHRRRVRQRGGGLTSTGLVVDHAQREG